MKSSHQRYWIVSALVGLLGHPSARAQVTFGHTDSFQDATTAGWHAGVDNPNSPAVVLDVGPLGAGDHSLRISSRGGTGPGSMLVAFNGGQWTGDYLGQGVTALTLDLRNVGSTDLNIRLAVNGPGGAFASTTPVPLAAGGAWQSAVLSLRPADLTSVGGTDAAATLGTVFTLRLLSSTSPSWRGDALVAELRVDNITAIPEPASFGGLAAAAGGSAVLFRRRRLSPAPPIPPGTTRGYGS